MSSSEVPDVSAVPDVPEADVSAQLAKVRSRIVDAGGDPSKVQVLAVTKGFGPSAIVAAYRAGLTQIGESYAQELVGKLRALTDGSAASSAGQMPSQVAEQMPSQVAEQIQVHFVGHAQTNKVRLLAKHVDVWQSIDRPSLVDEVAKRCGQATVMLQLKVSGAPSQGGCVLAQAPDLLARANDAGLDVIGVMAIGAQGAPETIRNGFETVRRFADDHGLAHRSFGMSGDLEQAIASGATMVRVGTALFGPRPSQ